MRTVVTLLTLAALTTPAAAEEIFRWTDAQGTIHYSNRAELAPSDATQVTTRLIVETTRMPGAPAPEADLVIQDGMVYDSRDVRPVARRQAKKARRIYTEERLRFDCFAGNILYSGGFSHPDDIAAVGNCLPYLLGPEAWLNGARAELALRANGIDWRQLLPWYLAQRDAAPPPNPAD